MKVKFESMMQTYQRAKGCFKRKILKEGSSLSCVAALGGAAGLGAVVGTSVGDSFGIPYVGIVGAVISVGAMLGASELCDCGDNIVEKNLGYIRLVTVVGTMAGIADVIGANCGYAHGGLWGGALGILASMASTAVDYSIKKKNQSLNELRPG